jgi:hypothetical protein
MRADVSCCLSGSGEQDGVFVVPGGVGVQGEADAAMQYFSDMLLAHLAACGVRENAFGKDGGSPR